MPRSARLERALPFVVGAAVLIVVLPSFWAPLGYDEGFNLQLVGNLLHGHGYATDALYPSGHPQLFDYRVTTGPTVMLPIATS